MLMSLHFSWNDAFSRIDAGCFGDDLRGRHSYEDPMRNDIVTFPIPPFFFVLFTNHSFPVPEQSARVWALTIYVAFSSLLVL